MLENYGKKSMNTLERHTAVPQLAGYLYQIQCALLRLFDLQVEESLGIEIVDDVHIALDNVVIEVGQYKYHIPKTQTKLTDKSSEFWKTLGIWASAVSDKSLDLSTIQSLVLFTRATPSLGSVIEMIAKNGNKDVDAIIPRLLAVPYPPKNNILCRSFDAVHALPAHILRELIYKVVIQDHQPTIRETVERLREKIRHFGFHQNSLDAAAQKFSGWLWEKVLLGLEDPRGVQIFESDFHTVKCLIRDEFAGNKLYPRYVEETEETLDPVEFVQQSNRIYVLQLDLIGASSNIKRRCILDYFRATCERNAWLESGEILPQGLVLFDRELYDRWKTEFDAMCDELDEQVEQDELKRVGRTHFHNIQRINVPIQPEWIYSYLTRGSYHILANGLSVGWHPSFKTMINDKSTC